MKVLIIEDEKPAVKKLELMLKSYDKQIEVLARLVSVKQSVAWLKEFSDRIDLIFMDIKLSDGLSFDIFKHVNVTVPIIFITAYNEFAIQAFKVNSIDYLLKPLNYEDLQNSLKKIKTLRKTFSTTNDSIQYKELNQVLKQLNRTYKTRFMVKVGEHIRSVKSENILLFYAEGRTVFIITNKLKKYIIDFKLESLESSLDPEMFFRPNRSFILNINSIDDVLVYSNSRLKVLLNFDFDKEIIVSREKVGALKEWFN
ncbi:MAG: DNA-binding response regulator [Bacteroidetes bacterium]|nr:MAG: DNA-binding response regulator [Bacteroidota bacterium]